MSNLNVALLISGDLLQRGSQLNGRRWAAQSWFRHWVGSDPSQCLNLIMAEPNRSALLSLKNIFEQFGWSRDLRLLDMANPSSMMGFETLFVPDPSISRWAHWRETVGPSSFSLVGQIHTISSWPSQSLLLDLVTEPVHSWDAVVCSSSAGRDVVASLIEDREHQISRRAGINPCKLRSHRPQLPIIPLPVDVDILQRLADRTEARHSLDLPADAHVVLWLGRLSMLTKQDPWPTYRFLDRVAQQLSLPLILLECGPDDTADQASHFEELRRLCPHLRFHRLGGSEPVSESLKHLALACSDVAVSLVDNTQETFGLSVAEAMASGLPMVVSDWNGYRDLVHHGVHGFRVPTRWMDDAAKASFPLAWSHLWGIYEFPAYAGALAQMVHVDLDSAEKYLLTLLTHPKLARAMGHAAQRDASLRFNGKEIMRQHHDLFNDLNERRLSASSCRDYPSSPPPLALDPVRCFKGYSTATPIPFVANSSEPLPPSVKDARSPLWNMIEKHLSDTDLSNFRANLEQKHS